MTRYWTLTAIWRTAMTAAAAMRARFAVVVPTHVTLISKQGDVRA